MKNTNKKIGKLIGTTLLKMYPGSFLHALMFGFLFMVDSILAGNTIGAEAISAVAIGLPCYGLFLALVNAIIHGTSLRVTWAKGRADQNEFQRAFVGGLTFAGMVGLFFTILVLVLAVPLTAAFGGAKTTPEIADYALLYVRCSAPMIFFMALSGSLRECVAVLGYQTERAVLGIINMVLNLIISIALVMVLPKELKMAGLGIGSSAAALIEFFFGVLVVRLRKINVRLKPALLKPKEMGQTVKAGLPASLDNVIDCVVVAVSNNIILAGIPDEPLILSVVSVVNNIKRIVRCAPTGTGYAAAPLFGVFYAERDKTALKKTVGESLRQGILFTVVWCLICLACLPLLSKLYGMELTSDIQEGVLLSMIFTPAFLILYLLTVFYESTERFGSSLLMAAVPDSLFYPIMLAVLIPSMGKTGMWIAVSANPFVGLIVLIPLMMLLSRKNPAVSDKILRLKPHIVNRSPAFEFEISDDAKTAVGISEKIQAFLLERGKSKWLSCIAALSTEELAVDMIASLRNDSEDKGKKSKVFDIRLFDDGDSAEILIRSMGKPYDPLQFDGNEEDFSKIGIKIVQKTAKAVTYTYVYKLNIVTIVLADTKTLYNK